MRTWRAIAVTLCVVSLCCVLDQSVVGAVVTARSSLTIPGGRAPGYVPPENPPANLWPSPEYTLGPGAATRAWVTSNGKLVGQKLPVCWKWLYRSRSTLVPVPEPTASACISAEVAATDRAQRAEGLPGIALPRNFGELSVPEQLLVLVDIERVSRGEPPVLGVSARVNVYAQQAAAHDADPELPPTGGGVTGATGAWGANWAAAVNTLDANYAWMYTDGWEAKLTENAACTGPHAPGCWGHRDSILANASRMPCYDPSCTIVMGAGYVPRSYEMYGSYTELLVQVAGALPKLYYTWSDALAAGARP